ncbi:MAG TPA: DUF87 domain-containing protein [bacterium]|nr:DUF87 domain-containing protein [bacterium]HPO11160.1 DUF87 domain-containing protein [bacterium]
MAFDIQQLSLGDDLNKKIEKKQKKSKDNLKKEVEKQKVEQTIQSLEEEKIYRRGITSVKDLIAPSSMRITPHYIEINGKFARTIFVVGYPRYITIGWFAPVINMNNTLDISMFFYPVDITLVLKQLRNRVGAVEAQLSADVEKGAPRNPLLQAALQDMERMRDDLTQGLEKFFQFALYVTVYADTEKELDQFSDDVDFLFGSKLVQTKRAFYQAEQGFNSCLPLGNDELNILFNMNSSPIASSFPFISSELTSNTGILYGINEHNNSLIIFDRFTLQNANSVVFATSGAGKSYAVKLEVLRSLMMGTEVIIIDPEFEYKTLSDAVGGTYINISLNSETKLNPFDLPKTAGISGVKVSDIIRSAVITLKGLLKLMIGDLTHQEDALVDRALLETYAKKDIDANSDLATVEAPLMQDFYDILQGMEGTEDISLRIKKFTEGTFSGLFNSPTNIEMNNQLVTFCVRDLEDELRPIGIYTIVNHIWNVIRSQLKKRMLVIDEAWWLMQSEDSAKFIFALVKRCRKYYLGVTTITQDVNDFLGNPYGRAIVTNSAMQILLKQAPAAIDNIAKVFMLTEGEKYLLLERGLGEGIFFAGQKHAAIKIIASYTEDQLITSDPRQILKLQEAKKEFEKEVVNNSDKSKSKK